MKIRDQRSISGFTLVEVLISSAIITFIIGVSLSVYVVSSRGWREGSVQINLQQKARLMMEKMIYGTAEATTVDGQPAQIRNGIIEAEQVQILADATRIDYRLRDDVWRSFYLNNGWINYQQGAAVPLPIINQSVGVQVEGATGVQFISGPNQTLIGISLNLAQTVGGIRASGGQTTLRFHLQSSAKRRN